MERLSEKYSKEIGHNEDKINALKKEKRKFSLQGILGFLVSNRDFFAERYKIKGKILDLEFENFLLERKPYQEWADSLSDREVDLKYLQVSKYLDILQNQPSPNINEYIPRLNALVDEFSFRKKHRPDLATVLSKDKSN